MLAYWSQRLLEDTADIQVIFFPISIRFRTNLASVVFPAITAQLLKLHGEDMTTATDAPVEVWRALMTNYLSQPLPEGRRLLLIIDGIDEAADWEAGADLFPHSLPATNRILLSARFLAGDLDGGNWLRRLGWDQPGKANQLALEPLTPKGVADVLKHTACPLDQLSTRLDIVTELHRLSEGDPLLVRLYVEDLWSHGEASTRLQPEDLQTIQPGIDGFFSRWWDDQRLLWGDQAPLREPSAQALLNLFACALGPLRQADCLELAPSESGLTLWTLEEVLRPFGRFVIGDGLKRGYTFSHPRLAYYFYERLQRSGQAQEQEARFVEWGQRTLTALDEHRLDPADAPAYLVQYFGAHLERVGCDIHDMLGMLGEGWLKAWEHFDRSSYLGFLVDAKRVLRRLQESNLQAARAGERLPHLAAEIRCALYDASVGTPAEIPLGLVNALVAKGLWKTDQGIAYVSRISSPRERLDALSDLGEVLPPNNRRRLIAPALGAMRGLTDPSNEDFRLFASLLCRLAEDEQRSVIGEDMPDLLQGGDSEQVEPGKLLLGSLLWVPTVLQPTWLSVALEKTRDLDPEERFGQLHPAARRAVEGTAGLMRAARDAAREIASPARRALCLFTLAFDLPDADRTGMLKESLAAARLVEPEHDRASLLREIQCLLPEPILGQALSAVLDLGRAELQAPLLTDLVCVLPQEEMVRVLQAAAGLKDPGLRIPLLRHMLPLLPEPLARKAAAALQVDGLAAESRIGRLRILAGIWTHLPGPEADATRRTWSDDAIRQLAAIDDQRRRSRAIAEYARVMGGPLPDQLVNLHMLEGITNPQERTVALLALVPHLAPHQADDALRFARGLPGPVLRVEAISEIAPLVSREGRGEALGLALSEIGQLSRPRMGYGVLQWMLRSSPEAWGHLEASLRVVRSGVVRPTLIARVLFPQIEFADSETAPDELVALASSIQTPWLWNRILSVCPAHLLTALLVRLLPIALRANTASRPALLETIVPLLSGDALADALSSIDWPAGAIRQVSLIPILAPHLPQGFLARMWRHFFDLKETRSPELLQSLAPSLAPATAEQLLPGALATHDEDMRFDLLSTLAPRLPDGPRARALEEIFRAVEAGKLAKTDRVALFPLVEPSFQGRSAKDCRFEWLAPELVDILNMPQEEAGARKARLLALAPHLNGQLLEEAIHCVWKFSDPFDRSGLFRALIPGINLPSEEALVEELLEHAEDPERHHPQVRGAILQTLAPILEDPRRSRVETLGRICILSSPDKSDDEKERELLDLVPVLDEGHMEEIVPLVSEMHSPSETLINALVPRLPDALRDRLLANAHNIRSASRRVHLLAALAPHLDPEAQSQAADAAMSAVYEIESTSERSNQISAIAHFLSTPQLERALAFTRYIGDAGERARLLVRLAAELPEGERRQAALDIAHRFALDVPAASERARVLCEIHPLCPQERAGLVLEHAVAAAQEVGYGDDQVLQALVPASMDANDRLLSVILDLRPSPGLVLDLIPHLPKNLLSRAFELAGLTWVSALFGDILTPCAPFAAPQRVLDMLTLFRSASGGIYRAPPRDPENPSSTDPMIIEALGTIDDTRQLRRLAPFLPRSEGDNLYRQALERASRIASGIERADALIDIATSLPEHLFPEALSLAQGMRIPDIRAGYLCRLVPLLPQDLFARAFREAEKLPEPHLRARVFKRLAALIPDAPEDETLAALRSVTDPVDRTRSLARAGQNLGARARQQAADEALRALCEIPQYDLRAELLGELAGKFPEDSLGRLLDAALEIADEAVRVGALSTIAPVLPELLLSRAVAEARGIACPVCRTELLASLIPHLSGDQQRGVLTEVASLPGSSRKARVLRVLFEHAPEELVMPALDATAGITQGFVYAELICKVFPRLPRDLAFAPAARALDAIREIGDGEYRGELLRRIAPHLPEAMVPQALDITETIDEAFDRADVLRTFVARAENGFRDNLLCAVRRLADKHCLAVLLAELATAEAETPQSALLDEALTRVQEIDCALHRAEALREVALRPSATTPSVLSAALAAALAVGRDYYAAELILDLAPRLPRVLMAEALTAIANLRDEELRARALARLAAFLPLQLLADALSIAETITSNLFRSQALVGLAPALPEGLLGRALDIGLGLEDAWHRVEVIAALTPSLPEPLLDRALAESRPIRSESMRLEALCLILPYLSESLLEEVLASADGFSHGPYASLLMLNLAEVAPKPLTRRVLEKLRALPESARHAEASQRLVTNSDAIGVDIGTHPPDQSTSESTPGFVKPYTPEPPTQTEISQAIQTAIEIPDLPLLTARPVSTNKAPGTLLPTIDRLESESDRLIALREIAPRLPPGSQSDALAVVKGFQNLRFRMEALKLVLPRLAGQALEEAVEISGTSIKPRDLDLIASFAPELCRLGGESRYLILRGLLQPGSGEARPALLRSLGAFGPLIAACGGEDAVDLTALAVTDAGAWWP